MTVSKATTVVRFDNDFSVSVGEDIQIPIEVNTVADTNGTYLANVKVEVVNQPTGSRLGSNNNGQGNGTALVASVAGDIENNFNVTSGRLSFKYTGTQLVEETIGTITIVPRVIGIYTIKITGYGNAITTAEPLLTNSSVYVTIYAEGTPDLTPQPAVINVNSLSAVLKCRVEPQNRNVTISCSVDPVPDVDIPDQTITNRTVSSTLTFNVTGLRLGTYSYSFIATDDTDPDFTELDSAVNEFTLIKKPGAFPTALTTELTGTTATLRGTIFTNGADTNVYFEYSTEKNFGTVNEAAVGTLVHDIDDNDRNVDAPITGLSRNERYYFRLIAENSMGTTISNSLGFSTNDVPEIDPDKIVVEFGKVTLEWTDVEAEEYEVQWSLVEAFPAPLSRKFVSENKAIITNLTNNVPYFFRVRVVPDGSFSNIVKLNVATTIKIHSFTPQSGSFLGGTQVSLFGENLMRVISVTFDTYPEKTPAKILSQTNEKIIVEAPAISNLLPVMNLLKAPSTTNIKIADFNKGKIRVTDNKGNTVETTSEFVYSVTPTTLGSVCFPAQAHVILKDGRTKTMKDLALGDHVQVSPAGEYSEVYLFTHALPTAEANFLTFTLASGLKLTLTPCHYLYVNGALLAAEKARIGDTVESTSSATDQIEDITVERDMGLYNPHTLSGDIMVNNVRTSTYTNLFPAKLAHAILEPVRLLYKLDKLF